MTDKLFKIIPIIIGLVFVQLPLSIILPLNYELVAFGISSSVIIGFIIYIQRLPDKTQTQNEVKQE